MHYECLDGSVKPFRNPSSDNFDLRVHTGLAKALEEDLNPPQVEISPATPLFFRASYVRLHARSCGKQAFRSFGINDQASEFLVRHRYNAFLNQEINCPCIGYMNVPANKLAQAITDIPACT